MPNVERRVTKNDMDRQHYNRLKIVLAEKEKTGTWLSEQMGRNIGVPMSTNQNKKSYKYECV